MAKILFFSIPAHGHINPTLPVVAELMKRGQRVIYFSSNTFKQQIDGTGAEYRAYPGAEEFEHALQMRIHNLVDVSVLLLETSLRWLPQILDTLEREKPDLLAYDSIALWGMLAGRVKDIPSVSSFSTIVLEGVRGIIQPRDMLHIVRQALTRLPALQRMRRQLVRIYGKGIFPGKFILPALGNANLVYTSRLFQPSTPLIDDSFHFVGPSVLPSIRQMVDFPWDLLDSKHPVILLSLGTLYNDNPLFYRAIILAFTDFPGQFILSTGQSSSSFDLGSVPSNFIIRQSVPQLDLLPKIDLFITHGGINSVHEALFNGVPLVVVPQQLEQAINGRLVARQGAGVVLADKPPYGRVEVEHLRVVVDQVLADPAYRRNASNLKASFSQAGGYQEAARVINSLLPGS